MSATILNAVLALSQVCLAVALALAVLRALRGPRAQDRVLGLDTMYVCAMLLLVVAAPLLALGLPAALGPRLTWRLAHWSRTPWRRMVPASLFAALPSGTPRRVIRPSGMVGGSGCSASGRRPTPT